MRGIRGTAGQRADALRMREPGQERLGRADASRPARQRERCSGLAAACAAEERYASGASRSLPRCWLSKDPRCVRPQPHGKVAGRLEPRHARRAWSTAVSPPRASPRTATPRHPAGLARSPQTLAANAGWLSTIRTVRAAMAIFPRSRGADYASAAQTPSNTDMSPSRKASRNGCLPERNSSVPSAPKTERPTLRSTFLCVAGSV